MRGSVTVISIYVFTQVKQCTIFSNKDSPLTNYTGFPRTANRRDWTSFERIFMFCRNPSQFLNVIFCNFSFLKLFHWTTPNFWFWMSVYHEPLRTSRLWYRCPLAKCCFSKCTETRSWNSMHAANEKNLLCTENKYWWKV